MFLVGLCCHVVLGVDSGLFGFFYVVDEFLVDDFVVGEELCDVDGAVVDFGFYSDFHE